MDDKRFDALTRSLATGASRRSVLRWLLGGAGAVAGTSVVRDKVSAQNGAICNVTVPGDCDANFTCQVATVGPVGVCVCLSPFVLTGDECVFQTTTTTAAPTTTVAPDPTTCVREGLFCDDTLRCCSGLSCVDSGFIGRFCLAPFPTTTTAAPTTTTVAPTTTTAAPTTTTESPNLIGDDDDDDDDDDGCGAFGEGCGLNVNGTFPAAGNPQFDCCGGLVCCNVEYDGGGAGFLCAECCDDYGCAIGQKCCFGYCEDIECCRDEHCGDCEICGQGGCLPAGGSFGDTCGVVRLLEGGSPQLDCCDGLVCCQGGGDDDDDDDVADVDDFNGAFCAECCGNWDCPKGSECRHGYCQFQCSHDNDCYDGTCCCKSGHCSKHCCEHREDDEPHKPEYDKPDDVKKPAHPAGGVKIDTLPSTGIGDDQTSAGWLGAAALGAAAAYIASKKLKDDAPRPEAAEE